MMARLFTVFCIQVVLVQNVFGQYILPSSVNGNSVIENTVVVGNGVGNGIGNGIGNGGNLAGTYLAGSNLANVGLTSVGNSLGTVGALGTLGGLGLGSLTVAPSGVLAVSSYSPIAPAGLTIVSDNTIEGMLTVNGQLPFLSAVAFESSLATSGQGTASCGCGDGNIGITNEGVPSGYGLGLGGLGYGAGLAGRRF